MRMILAIILSFISCSAFAANEMNPLCRQVLAALSGAEPIIVNGQTRHIRDRSAHIRVNEHDITIEFLESTIKAMGFSFERQTWMQPTTAQSSRLWMRPNHPEVSADAKPSGRFGVRSFISDVLRGPQREPDFSPPVFYSLRGEDGSKIARRLTNLIVDIEPANGDPDAPVIVIGAHYDAVNNESGAWHGSSKDIFLPYEANPGADDNASGVVGAIELLRRFQIDRPSQASLRFIFFDAEEPGIFGPLRGSRHYVSTLPASERNKITLAITLDMIGKGNYPKPDSYNASGFGLSPAILKLGLSGGNRDSLGPSPYIQIPGQRNFISVADSYNFNRALIPNLLITDVISTAHLPSHYHNETDIPQIIDSTYMNGVIAQIENLIRHQDLNPNPLLDREAMPGQVDYLPDLGIP